MSPCWSYLFIAIKMAIAGLVVAYFLLRVTPMFFAAHGSYAHRITLDLSHTLEPGVMRWLTDRPFELKIRNGTRTFGNRSIWYQTEEMTLSSHTGTHLDAPVHFFKDGYSVDDIPLVRLIERPLVIIDVTEQSQSRRDYAVSVEDIREFEESNGEIPEESFVAFRTGWSRHWPDERSYWGTESKEVEKMHFPGVSASAARFLAFERRVVGVGIDSPSIDCGQCGHRWGFPAHVQLAQANVYAVENLDINLFRLPNSGATITVLPLKVASASGAPARVIAQYSHNHHDTNAAPGLAASLPTLLLFALIASKM